MDKRNVTITTSINSDGIDKPTVSIYFSYCDREDFGMQFCKGCHNAHLQKDGYGSLLSVEDIVKILDKKLRYMDELTNTKVELAFLGGEPLADINSNFVRSISEHYKNRNQILYTWRDSTFINSKDIIYIDRIVCGEYLEDKKVDDYVLGSKNQYIINSNKEVILNYKES